MKRIFFIIVMYLFSCATHGGVYQWTDENGHVSFGSIPPRQQKEYSAGDRIKAAQKKRGQPAKENELSKASALEKNLKNTPSPVLKIKSTPIQKMSKKELEAIIIKRRHDAVGAVKHSKDKNEKSKKANMEVIGESKIKEPAAVDVGIATENPKAKSIVSDDPVITNKVLTAVELDKVEDKIMAEPAIDQKLEVEVENNGGEDIATAINESVAMPELANEPKEVADLFGEEDSTDEEDEVVFEKNTVSDKCGLFMGFVAQYKIKEGEGCPGPHCNVYKRQLKKFKAKEKSYCG